MEALSKIKQKWIRSLQLKKNRDSEGLFVVEGEKMVLEGLTFYASQLEILIVHQDFKTLVPKEFLTVTFSVSEKDFEQISSLKTPNKLLAVFRATATQEPKKIQSLVLDNIQDPGNMGTILRLADWFGIQQIICSTETVDVFNPKVIQASMGAIYRVSVVYTDLITFLTQTNQKKYGALLHGVHYKKTAYDTNGLLIMGNEGKGIRPEIESLIDVPVTIPRVGGAESLNVASATSILLAEMVNP